MTGDQLADELEAFFNRRPDISRARAGIILHRKRNLVTDIRKYPNPTPKTVERVLAFIANPPAEALKIPMHKRKRPGPQSIESNQRRAASMRRTIAKKAAAMLDGDTSALSVGGKPNAALAAAALIVQQQRATKARLEDPVEQALLKVRKRRIVFRASVYGGPHNRFYISGRGRETIDESELLQLAQKVA